jgi:hypothetical protein
MFCAAFKSLSTSLPHLQVQDISFKVKELLIHPQELQVLLLDEKNLSICITSLLFQFGGVKFLFAPTTATLAGFSYWQTILITIGGGIFGVYVFYNLSDWINRRFSNAFILHRKSKYLNQTLLLARL